MSVSFIDGHIDEPKKPIIHGVREDRTVNTISYTCSVCNERIGITEDYCKQCGQALDWSAEKIKQMVGDADAD